MTPQEQGGRTAALNQLRRIANTSVLGPTALNVLGIICRAAQEGRPPPSGRDVCKKLGFSPNAFHLVLDRLEHAGLITRERFRARTVRPAFRFLTPEELECEEKTIKG